jgi:hypothetical protein
MERSVVAQKGERWASHSLVTITVSCRHCGSENLVGDGLIRNGKNATAAKIVIAVVATIRSRWVIPKLGVKKFSAPMKNALRGAG